MKDRVVVEVELLARGGSGDIPEMDKLVTIAGDEQLVIGVPAKGADRSSVIGEGGALV